MIEKMLLATRNKKKKRELLQLLQGMDIDILTMEDFDPPLDDVVEDGASFQQNAMKKSLAAARQSGLIALADDSGLVVEALEGRPGVHSARFAGEKATDEDNNLRLLQELRNLPVSRRQAYFVCVLALCSPQGGLIKMFEGRCYGHIAFSPRGEKGFGYDPLFIPRGYERTFAELEEEEKHRISHRGQALQEFRAFLQRYES